MMIRPSNRRSGRSASEAFGRLFPWIMAVAGGYVVGYFHGGIANSYTEPLLSSSLSSLNTQIQQQQQQQKEDSDGWKSIHVFYGNQSHLVFKRKKKSWYSQAHQDKVVVALLRGMREGYFVDLAANHAFRLSNSYILEQSYGWRGLCIEANPKYWSSLSYRKCHVAAAVVGSTRMEEVDFRFDNGVFGGISSPGFDNQEQNATTEKRFTVPLQEILEHANAPTVIDYFSLDVEGAEEYIMESFPFDLYRMKIMTIERPKAKLKAILAQNNYELLGMIHRIGETLWVHKEYMADLDMAAFAEMNVTIS